MTETGPVVENYDFKEIEDRWTARWEAERLGEPDLDLVLQDRKFYNLVEFPYPSAEGLHIGHAFTYSGADTYGRYRRMLGRDVFQPIGFDSFGIHTENYALRIGERPDVVTARTTANFRRQLRRMGGAWAWSHQLTTSDPRYYRWTQWIFLRLLESGLAVRQRAPVVWCPSCLTVLAREQLEDDRCERCGTPVTEKVMEQWFLRITAYADALLDGLRELDWPRRARRVQEEWIGRSRGIEVEFEVEGTGERLTAFTTRPDTLFGVTFLAVSPDHPRAAELAGRRAINPANGSPVPIVVADYVLATYGTGMVMGVPAHDSRDWEFAHEHGLPIVRVVHSEQASDEAPWTGEGVLVDSGPFSGVDSATARKRITRWLVERGVGRPATRFRLHDWLISRQRYWGPPIPVVYCPICGIVPVPADQLPVLLPELDDFRPTGTGLSPLASVESFVATACPRCGGPARRETDVSDTFFDSAWYYLRYLSTDFDDRPWDAQRTERWLPVDVYFGSREHVARHHLYARFLARALHDLGLVPFQEPFPRLRLHGEIVSGGGDGPSRKMSKSLGNVVDPDAYIDRVGADNLRLYLLFGGDWQEGGEFDDGDLMGIVRFTRRLWRLLTADHQPGPGGADLSPLDRAILKVGRDLERLKFNTAIAALMELSHWLAETRGVMSAEEWARASSTFTLLLAPFAPYLAEELWHRRGGEGSVHRQPWPQADHSASKAEEVTLVVQVNGRVRGRRLVPTGLDQDDAVLVALSDPAVERALQGREPSRVVYVPDRLVNLLV
jgi:leucyl-tRNA synthetase